MTTNGQTSALLPCPFCALEAEMRRGGRFFTATGEFGSRLDARAAKEPPQSELGHTTIKRR
jgi:hypothetical protein